MFNSNLSDEIIKNYDFTVKKVKFNIIFSHFVKISGKIGRDAKKAFIFQYRNMSKVSLLLKKMGNENKPPF